jgi:hypothetical protein
MNYKEDTLARALAIRRARYPIEEGAPIRYTQPMYRGGLAFTPIDTIIPTAPSVSQSTQAVTSPRTKATGMIFRKPLIPQLPQDDDNAEYTQIPSQVSLPQTNYFPQQTVIPMNEQTPSRLPQTNYFPPQIMIPNEQILKIPFLTNYDVVIADSSSSDDEPSDDVYARYRNRFYTKDKFL